MPTTASIKSASPSKSKQSVKKSRESDCSYRICTPANIFIGGDNYFLHEMSNIVGSFVLVGSFVSVLSFLPVGSLVPVGSFVMAESFVPVGYFMSNGSFVQVYFRSWLRENIFGYSPMVNV